jgi:hypothetical protein
LFYTFLNISGQSTNLARWKRWRDPLGNGSNAI